MYFLSPAEISALLTSMVWALPCLDVVVPCGNCCSGCCCGRLGCSPAANSGNAGPKTNPTDTEMTSRGVIRFNVEVYQFKTPTLFLLGFGNLCNPLIRCCRFVKNCPMNDNKACNCGKSCDCGK